MPKYIKTIAPVDSLSGKFGKRLDSISGKTIIANVRKAATNTNNGRPYMFFSVLTKTTYKGTAAQIAWNHKFAEICAATRERLINASQMNADRAAFAAQTEYKTLYSFVWNLVYQSME